MNSEDVPYNLRVSRIPALKLIAELEKANRIQILKQNRRNGQSHSLTLNRTSNFDSIIGELSRINNDVMKLQDPMRLLAPTKNKSTGQLEPTNKSIQEVITEYNKTWIPGVESFQSYYRILLSKTSNLIHTDAESKVCYDQITKSIIDLTKKEYKVKGKVERLKRYKKYFKSTKKK